MSGTPWPLRLWLGGSAALPRPVEDRIARRVHDGQRAAPDRLAERLGRATRPRPEGRLCWINAASVGEVASIADLARDLAEAGWRVLVTTTTSTGAARAARIEAGVIHQYLPLDTARAARRFLDHWRPDLACMVEGDLWPRLLAEARERGVPLALLNARPSRSRARAPRLTAALMQGFGLVTAQDEDVAAEIAALGFARDRITVPGDLKAAAAPLPVDAERLAAARQAIADAPLWAAVSTHAGDEEAVIAAHLQARARHPGLRLVLAPRHPERADAVAALLEQAGLSHARHTETAGPGSQEVWLVDAIGETGLIFRLAPLVFLGGSFGPQGGHNPWEAARLGAALLHGPRLHNAPAAYAALDRSGAARCVERPEAIGAVLADLLGSNELAAMRTAAGRVMADRGAARLRTLSALRRLCDEE
ncbi:3-deoxy-D-manno-octulosonic acid transferase [Limimaricola pyoseonensis]|uniref:3-deoxy-D-manno-octulosonic acid transferase n=1 Tax=Limimaricola pyoseonensis TaxID=521013 RepID=A0A1G6ZCU6_9RHOB|nr:glycosyltransferase N-terminal domain-containing protein [Limimaricola pyoseonensis]SDE00341.1 3-deoxy-D-manno-octulosonic-acid transferase [Limimaricola pyoseonensis]